MLLCPASFQPEGTDAKKNLLLSNAYKEMLGTHTQNFHVIYIYTAGFPNPIRWWFEVPCHPSSKRLLLLSLLVTSRLDSSTGTDSWCNISWFYKAVGIEYVICARKKEGRGRKSQMYQLKQTSVSGSTELQWEHSPEFPKQSSSTPEASVPDLAFRPLLSFEFSRWDSWI